MAWGFISKEDHVAGYDRIKKLTDGAAVAKNGRYAEVPFDKQLTFDKITDVFHAGVSHDEDQPSHLHVLDTEICATRCAEEFANPCQRFCPAAVYEMEFDAKTERCEGSLLPPNQRDCYPQIEIAISQQLFSSIES